MNKIRTFWKKLTIWQLLAIVAAGLGLLFAIMGLYYSLINELINNQVVWILYGVVGMAFLFIALISLKFHEALH